MVEHELLVKDSQDLADNLIAWDIFGKDFLLAALAKAKADYPQAPPELAHSSLSQDIVSVSGTPARR